MIRLTAKGEKYAPNHAREPYNFLAWAGIKKLLRVKEGAATRDEILAILEYCWYPNPRHQPNTAFLKYALDHGWLVED